MVERRTDVADRCRRPRAFRPCLFDHQPTPDRGGTTASGPAASTAALTAALSKASTTAGVAPAWLSDSAFAGDRAGPVTLRPAATSSGTRRLPTAPVAPAISTRIDLSPLQFLRCKRTPARSRGSGVGGRGARRGGTSLLAEFDTLHGRIHSLLRSPSPLPSGVASKTRRIGQIDPSMRVEARVGSRETRCVMSNTIGRSSGVAGAGAVSVCAWAPICCPAPGDRRRSHGGPSGMGRFAGVDLHDDGAAKDGVGQRSWRRDSKARRGKRLARPQPGRQWSPMSVSGFWFSGVSSLPSSPLSHIGLAAHS